MPHTKVWFWKAWGRNAQVTENEILNKCTTYAKWHCNANLL